jgi:hypothetical protein
MTNFAREFVKGAFNALGLQSSIALRVGGVLKEDGWFESYRRKESIDGHGNPIPWFTYPAIDFINRRLRSDMKIFEYGCGASTLWWAKRVGSVVSCEHDEQWYRKIVALAPSNVTIHHVEFDNNLVYAGTIQKYERVFDLVVIDGPDRVNCAMRSLEALKDSGIIIWDDSERDKDECAEGFRFLREHGFRCLEFVGLSPIVPNKCETSIFYRQNNTFGI